jgi:pimeloyl-ACP methyl ester carboxylesterase
MQAQIDGRSVPLEYDQTAAFALGLAQSGVWSRELLGFLSSDWLDISPTMLLALEPHQLGRIPVVFVHGTASSPGRWADMMNDLFDDPRIADNYEFWFFTYATGNPIPYSALLLREHLQQAIAGLGGAAADPALGRIVVVGHSQGGLLAKMLAIDSGSRLWDAVSRRPLDQMALSVNSREQLRRALFVTPLPELHRVVFIATPQRGSFVAGFSISRMIGRLVFLPLHLAEMAADLVTDNADALAVNPRVAGFSSISGMTPGNPLINALASIPVAPGIRANSIIAVQGDGPIETGNDGVVEYSSAHIDGVESELVVRSGHSTQQTPATIEEVRRILLQNLADKPL